MNLPVFLRDVLLSALSMLNSASVWMIFSFFAAGIIHEFVSLERMQRFAIGSRKFSGRKGSVIPRKRPVLRRWSPRGIPFFWDFRRGIRREV